MCWLTRRMSLTLIDWYANRSIKRICALCTPEPVISDVYIGCALVGMENLAGTVEA
jgi:hypothetical protein